DIVKPGLISYDHYQLTAKGDSPDYFLNLALIRQTSLDSGLPFLNIVQAASWAPSMRVPNSGEVRFLVYTSLAYGAQGISYYVYCCAGHTGGIANPDGSPTPLYDALRTLNHDFVEIARELQPLKSMGVYHAGMIPPGGETIPKKAAFLFDPPISAMEYKPPQRLQGALIGMFGEPSKRSRPTHALVVNLDYTSQKTLGVRGLGRLEIFDPATGQWRRSKKRRVELNLSPGGGTLVKLSH
ncbi:MAG TPA: beta-galactosidase, partial [Verrucomicrobiae bacterium]|nr:beta-galactosidase [Verrucomicrobiae bacterium]